MRGVSLLIVPRGRVESRREVIPLLMPKVQTGGVAPADPEEMPAFAEAATQAAAARWIRPGIINNHESPLGWEAAGGPTGPLSHAETVNAPVAPGQIRPLRPVSPH